MSIQFKLAMKISSFVLAFSLVACVIVDAFMFRVYTPHIYSFVKNSSFMNIFQTWNEDYDISKSSMNGMNTTNYGALLAHLDQSPTEHQNISFATRMALYNSNNKKFAKALKKLGLEHADSHLFKSPYIVTPPAYRVLNHTDMKAPGTRRVKVISLHHFHSFAWFIRSRPADFKQCPYSECTLDTTGKKVDTADLVMFICKSLGSPPPKRPGQLWALFCRESAAHWNYPRYDTLWKNKVNMLLGFRMGGDIFNPCLKLAWRDSDQLLTLEEYVAFAKKKTKTAAWWASNCRSDRLNYVRRMQKYIDIDIYGGCGPLKCPRNNPRLCRERLNTTYKFYLGFENSYCQDYVTEKFQKCFESRLQVIPVAKGAFDYDRYIPPNMFVNGNKFKTAKDLALYLKDLGNDVPRYAKMLQEKDKLTSQPAYTLDWCRLCEILHTEKPGIRYDIKSLSHTNVCRGGGYTDSNT